MTSQNGVPKWRLNKNSKWHPRINSKRQQGSSRGHKIAQKSHQRNIYTPYFKSLSLLDLAGRLRRQANYLLLVIDEDNDSILTMNLLVIVRIRQQTDKTMIHSHD